MTTSTERIRILERELLNLKRAQRKEGKQPRNEPGGALYFAIGMAIREARCAKGLNQETLARMAGLSRTSIVNIEGGNQRLPLATLYDIADVLGVQASLLLPHNEDV